MVAFDASTPTPSSDPNWLGWSRAIKQPEPDKSGEILGKTIGTAISKVGEIGHDVVQETARSGSEDILKGEIGKLQAFQSGGTSGEPAQDQSLVNAQGSAAESPPEVGQAQQVAETLTSAKANGAISPTYYYGQLDKYSSDMRSRFPMFRGAIDKGIAKATGVSNTAEELYKSTMRDINSFLTKKDESKNKLLSKALESPGSLESMSVFKGLTNGTMGTDEAADRLQKVHAFDFAVKQNNEFIANKKANREETAHDAFSGLTVELHNQMATISTNAAEELGLTPSQIDDYTKHPEKLKAPDMQIFAQKFDAYRNTVRQKLTEIANQQRYVYDSRIKKNVPVDPYSAQTPEWEKAVNTAMNTFDHTSTLIKDGQVGPLHHWANMEKAVRQDFSMSMLMDRSGIIGPMMASKFFKDNGMDKVGQGIIEDIIADKFPEKVRGIVNSLRTRSMMTPAQAGIYGGKPSESLADDLELLYNHGMNKSEIKGTFVNDLHNLTKSDAEFPVTQKAALILHTFGPKNIDNLSAWQRNGIQPDGTVSSAPDRWNILGAMTDPKITQEVWKLNSDSRFKTLGLWDNYKSTTNLMIRKEFQKQALELNGFQAQVEYNSNTGTFKRIVPEGVIPRSGIHPENHPVQRLLDKLNIGVQSMRDIAKQEGSHPDAYVYNMMKDLGFDMDKSNTTGTMMESLKNTHAAQQKKHDDEMNKMVEEVKGLGKKKPQ